MDRLKMLLAFRRLPSARLAGASLIETLVALTLTTIVMATMWLTLEWVLTGSHQRENLDAHLLINLAESRMTTQSETERWQLDTLGYSLYATLSPSDLGKDLFTLSTECTAATGRKYASHKLLYLPER